MSRKTFDDPEQIHYISWMDMARFALAIFIFGIAIGMLIERMF